jgi:hypothetical protein
MSPLSGGSKSLARRPSERRDEPMQVKHQKAIERARQYAGSGVGTCDRVDVRFLLEVIDGQAAQLQEMMATIKAKSKRR